MPKTNQFYAEIEWSQSMNLIHGYSNGKYEPKKTLTEANFVIIFARLIEPGLASIRLDGYSVDERDIAYSILKSESIEVNRETQNNPATRFFISRILFQYIEGSTPGKNEVIQWMYDKKLTNGKGVSKDKYIDFGGNDLLKREHAATFMKRFFELVYYPQKKYQTPYILLGDYMIYDEHEFDFDGDQEEEMLEIYGPVKFLEHPHLYYVFYDYNHELKKYEVMDYLKWNPTIPIDNILVQTAIINLNGNEILSHNKEDSNYRRFVFTSIINNKIVIDDNTYLPRDTEFHIDEGKFSFWLYDSLLALYDFKDGQLIKAPLHALTKDIDKDTDTKEWEDTYLKTIYYDVADDGTIISSIKEGETIILESYQELHFQQGEDNLFDEEIEITFDCFSVDCSLPDVSLFEVTIHYLRVDTLTFKVLRKEFTGI